MTMLAHTLKTILELIPEALPFVKQASVDKEMPLDNKDSTIATALQLKYLEKVAYRPVDIFAIEKIAKAVHMYGVTEDVTRLSNAMIKAASEQKIRKENDSDENYFLKVASFEGELSNVSVEDRSAAATYLYKEATKRNLKPSDAVILYSGNAYLSKEAAVQALSVRYNFTGNTDFVKIASALGKTPDVLLSSDILLQISDTICNMDKVAGLHFKGHNFYKEAFFVKEAAFKGSINVRLCGKDVPYESIARVGREKIASYMGSDIASEMDNGPANFKAVIETLPLDLQNVLSSLVKNV